MSIKPQSKSPIPQTLHPAEPVRTNQFPPRRKIVSKSPQFQIHSSAKDEDSCPEGSLAFLRRYGKTYSPYGNLTPAMRKFGKTYSSRGNLKLSSGSSSSPSSQSQSDKQKVSCNETVAVDNSLSTQTPIQNSKFYTLKKVSEKNDMTYSKKVIIKNHATMLGSGSRDRDIIELATRNLKLPCNQSAKKMIVLNDSSSGKPVVTLYLVPNSEATTSAVSNDSSRDGTSAAATSAGGAKAPSIYQPVLADKNCAASGSIILLDQTNSASLGNVGPVSERNDTLSTSADPQQNTVANKISGLDTVAVQSEKSILDAPKQLKQKDILPVSVSTEEVHSDVVSHSDAPDVQPQNNASDALKSADSLNNGTKENSLPAKKCSISDISTNATKLLESKKKVKDIQKERSPFMKSDRAPSEIDKNLARATKEISEKPCEPSLELENSNSCSKEIISDDKKSTSKPNDNRVKWSHSPCPRKKKLKDSSFENDAVVKKRKRKKEKEKQEMKKVKKVKLKPVQKDPPGLEGSNLDSPVDNKNAKKMITKKKNISEQKKESKKEKLLKSKTKGKISNLKKTNKKSSKKKAKISTLFLSNVGKDDDDDDDKVKNDDDKIKDDDKVRDDDDDKIKNDDDKIKDDKVRDDDDDKIKDDDKVRDDDDKIKNDDKIKDDDKVRDDDKIKDDDKVRDDDDDKIKDDDKVRDDDDDKIKNDDKIKDDKVRDDDDKIKNDDDKIKDDDKVRDDDDDKIKNDDKVRDDDDDKIKGDDDVKVKKLSLPKLETSASLVANEEQSEREASETATFDGMPVLEDATKMVPLPCDDFQTMPILQESVKPSTIKTESYTEESGKLLDLRSVENTKASLPDFLTQDLLNNSSQIPQPFISQQNNPVPLHDTKKEIGHFDSSNTHNIDLAHLKPLANVSATETENKVSQKLHLAEPQANKPLLSHEEYAMESEMAKCDVLSELSSVEESKSEKPTSSYAMESEMSKCDVLSELSSVEESKSEKPTSSYAMESEMSKCDVLSELSSVEESKSEKPTSSSSSSSSVERGPSAVMGAAENTEPDVTMLSIMQKKKKESLKLSPETQKGKIASLELSPETQKGKIASLGLSPETQKGKIALLELSPETQKGKIASLELSTEAKKRKLKSEKNSTDAQLGKPKLSGDTQVGKSKLSTEKHVDKAKLPIDKRVDKPKSSSDKRVDKPKSSSDKRVDKPKSSSDKRVDKPKSSSDKRVDKPKSSSDKHVDKPKSSPDKHVDKPKSSSDKNVGNTKSSPDKPVDKPKSSLDKRVDKPKSSSDKRVDKPKSSSDKRVDKPKSSSDKRVDKPKSSSDKRVDKPKSSSDKRVDKPKSSPDKHVDKPKSSSDKPVDKPKSSSDKPKSSSDKPVDKPKSSSDKPVDKPKSSTKTHAVKPKMSTETNAGKPKLTAEPQSGKPKLSSETHADKTKVSTDAPVCEPPPSTDSQVRKPPLSTDTQVCKPQPSTDTRVCKPPLSTDTRVCKPPPSTDAQVCKLPPSTDAQVCKPPPSTDAQVCKPPLSTDAQGCKPPPSAVTQVCKPPPSDDAQVCKPLPSADAQVCKPPPSTDAQVCKPPPSAGAQVCKPPPSADAQVCKPPPSADAQVCKPPPSADAQVCKPPPSAGAQVCKPPPSADAQVCKPTTSSDAEVGRLNMPMDTNMGKPELSTEGEKEKQSGPNQQVSCKPLILSCEAGDVRFHRPNFPVEVKSENSVNLSSATESIKSEPPALLRALKLVKKSPQSYNSEQTKMAESELSDSPMLNPLNQMKTLSSVTLGPSQEISDTSNIQTTKNISSSSQISIQSPMFNISTAITSADANSDSLETKECVPLQAVSSNSTDISNSVCKTFSLNKNENETSPTDNTLPKNTPSHNASLSNLELFSSSGLIPSVSTQKYDLATLKKSPSVSLPDPSICLDATPTTAEDEDESSDLHLYLSPPEFESETERKKMLKKRNRKTKSAARFCFHCKTQIDAKSLSQNLVKQCRCQNCCQNSPSSQNAEAKLPKKPYPDSEKNLSTDGRPEISSSVQLLCSVCHRPFNSSYKLRAHMRWHRGRKPHHCCLCGKKFLQKAHLLGHMRSHRGECPNKCSNCQKTFQSVKNLCVHLRLCSKETLSKCPDCPPRSKLEQSEHLDDHQSSKNGHLSSSSLQIEDLDDNSRSQNENNDICDSKGTCAPSDSSSSLHCYSSESVKTLSTIRQEKRQNRMRMLQRHLAGEEAVDVGIEQANKVASTCNNESQDSVLPTLAPKLAENNKDLVEQAPNPVAEPVSPNLPQIESQTTALENDQSANDVCMDLKVNHSFSLNIGDFQAITSGESMQEVHDSNASKIDFIMTDPDRKTTPSSQELLLPDLPPPLLSPENVSSSTSVTLALPVKTEEPPPLLPKVLSVYSLGLNNENQKTFSSDLFKVETGSTVSNPDMGEAPAFVPPLCPDHETSAVHSAGDNAGKEIEVLVKKEFPEEKSTKEWEDLEKTDDLTSDTFHEQERVIFLPTNGQNISAHSRSMHLVDWPRTIVQCSVEEQPDDIDPIQESKSSSGQSQGTWSVKEKSNEANCKTLSEEKENGESAKKRKLSVKENSGACKYSNWEESNILSSTCLESPPPSNPAKKHCPDTERIKQEPYSSINDDNFSTKDSNESPLKSVSSDNDSSGSDLQRPKKESYGMSKRNLSRLPSEPVRYLPKRNYKKPQKYFCDDFDYSISLSSMKPKTSNPVSTTTTTGTSTVTVSNISESKSGSCELSEKTYSHQVNKTNDNSSQNNRTKAANNKVNENVNNNNNKSNDINNKNNNNNNNNNNGSKKILSLNPQTKESADKSSPPNVASSQRSKRKYDMTKRNLKKEMREKSEKLSRDQLTKNFLRLRFNLPESAEEFELQEQYHKKKLLKNATIKKHTVIPKIAKARKSPQTSPKKCSESHYGLVKMAQADQKPFLSAVTTERKILPAPPKTRREELLENLINYSSANFVTNDDANNNSSQKNSEELDVRTEPTQLSKLLGSPLAVLPAAAAPNSTLPSPVATVTTHCEAPSVTTIATLIPVTSMKTADNMPIPVTVLANPLPAVTGLENNHFFMGNLPAPLPENVVPDQKPVLSQILPLPEVEQKPEVESTKDFCPVLQIKKEIVTSDDEGYGGKQSDGLSGLRITGVTGGVTTHDTIPINSDAICSNAMSVSGHDSILNPNNHRDWSVTRRRPLRCVLVQTEDGFGRSEFTFECCELSFSRIPELASHLDSCHK